MTLTLITDHTLLMIIRCCSRSPFLKFSMISPPLSYHTFSA